MRARCKSRQTSSPSTHTPDFSDLNLAGVHTDNARKFFKSCQERHCTHDTKVSSIKQSHMKKPHQFHVRTVLSNSSIFLVFAVVTTSVEGNLWQDEKEKEAETIFQGENGKSNCSVSGDCIYRYHEARRSTLYVPQEETFTNSNNIRRRDNVQDDDDVRIEPSRVAAITHLVSFSAELPADRGVSAELRRGTLPDSVPCRASSGSKQHQQVRQAVEADWVPRKCSNSQAI